MEEKAIDKEIQERTQEVVEKLVRTVIGVETASAMRNPEKLKKLNQFFTDFKTNPDNYLQKKLGLNMKMLKDTESYNPEHIKKVISDEIDNAQAAIKRGPKHVDKVYADAQETFKRICDAAEKVRENDYSQLPGFLGKIGKAVKMESEQKKKRIDSILDSAHEKYHAHKNAAMIRGFMELIPDSASINMALSDGDPTMLLKKVISSTVNASLTMKQLKIGLQQQEKESMMQYQNAVTSVRDYLSGESPVKLPGVSPDYMSIRR